MNLNFTGKEEAKRAEAGESTSEVMDN